MQGASPVVRLGQVPLCWWRLQGWPDAQLSNIAGQGPHNTWKICQPVPQGPQIRHTELLWLICVLGALGPRQGAMHFPPWPGTAGAGSFLKGSRSSPKMVSYILSSREKCLAKQQAEASSSSTQRARSASPERCPPTITTPHSPLHTLTHTLSLTPVLLVTMLNTRNSFWFLTPTCGRGSGLFCVPAPLVSINVDSSV